MLIILISAFFGSIVRNTNDDDKFSKKEIQKVMGNISEEVVKEIKKKNATDF